MALSLWQQMTGLRIGTKKPQGALASLSFKFSNEFLSNGILKNLGTLGSTHDLTPVNTLSAGSIIGENLTYGNSIISAWTGVGVAGGRYWKTANAVSPLICDNCVFEYFIKQTPLNDESSAGFSQGAATATSRNIFNYTKRRVAAGDDTYTGAYNNSGTGKNINSTSLISQDSNTYRVTTGTLGGKLFLSVNGGNYLLDTSAIGTYLATSNIFYLGFILFGSTYMIGSMGSFSFWQNKTITNAKLAARDAAWLGGYAQTGLWSGL